MAIQNVKAYQDFIDFLLSMPSPEAMVKYHYAEPENERVSELLSANQNRRLTDAENAELDDYQEIGRIIRWTKVRALEKLQPEKSHKPQETPVSP